MPGSTHRAARRLFAACLLLAATGAAAQNWTGATNNNWSTGSNWFGGTAPLNNGTASLEFGASGVSFTPNADVAWSLAEINFTAIGYAVGGNALTFPNAASISVTGVGNSISNALSIGSSLIVDCAADFTLFGGATGPGELTKKGPSTLTYLGALWPAGTVHVGDGMLRIGDGATGPGGVGNLVNDGQVSFAYFTDVNGPVSGSGSITIESGASVSNLSGSPFTHQGQTTVNGLLLADFGPSASITNNAPLVIGPSGQVNTGSGLVGSLAGSGFLELQFGTFTAGGNNTSTTFSGQLSGSGTFAKAGAGTLTFETFSWFSLPSMANVQGGTLRLGTATAWPTNVGGFVNNAHLVFGYGGVTVNGPVSGSGAITIDATANVNNLSGGAFNHQGTTTINGLLFSAFGYGASITNNAPLVIGPSGQFHTEGGTVGSLAGSGLLNLQFGTFAAGGNNTSTTFTGQLDGFGTFAKAGAGTLTFETFSWFDLPSMANVQGGTLRLGTATAWPTNVGGFVNDAHLVFGFGGSTVNGPVSGSGAITIDATANVTNQSGGAFTHQGQTTINGLLFSAFGYGASITNNAPLVIGPSGQFYAEGGTVGSLAGSGLLNLQFGTLAAGGDDTSTTFSGTLAGSGTFAKAGSGTLTIETFSWFNLPSMANVQGGTLRLGTATAWPTNVGGFVNDAHLVFGYGGSTVNGPVSGSGAITIDATANVTNQSGGAFTHQGQTTINGLLFSAFGYGASITNNAPLVIGPSGQFYAEGGTVGSLAGSGLLNLQFGTFSIGGNNISTTFSGTFQGSGNFTKTGSGTLTLSGNSSAYSGATTINAGTLSVTGSHGGLTVGASGTLKGTGTVGAVTVASGGTLAPGLSAGTLATLGLNLSGILSAEILGPATGTQHDSVNVTGSVAINDATLALSGSYVPAGSDQFVLIANNGSDPVTGTFAGLAEGATLTFNGRTLRISYTGGSGNDVVLSVASYIVTPSAGANGIIAPSTPQSIAHGATTAFTVTPNAGYTASVGGTCGGNLVGNTYTTQAITADCTVTASFVLNTYTVSPSAGSNGTIGPNTPQTVAHGSTVAFAVTPSTGYTATVGGTCGGTLVGNVYTTQAITANCSVIASFALNTYTVTPSAGPNGTISPSTPQTIAYGAAVSFTVAPNPSFQASVGGTCGGTLVGNTYTTLPITASCTVVATFALGSYTVTPSAGPNGTIAPSTPQTVAHGSAISFAITPEARFGVSVGGTCGGSLAGNIFTTNPITASCTVAVTFEFIDPPRLVNISTRMQVLTGDDVLIGGFVIGGSSHKTVAIIATGPSLAAFGITNPLANPRLMVVRSSDQTVVATNDDWQTASNASQLQAAGLAPSDPLEAAALVNLAPGAYTAVVQGAGDATGVGVIAVYEVDAFTTPLINISARGRVQTGDNVMIGGFIIQGNGPQTVAIVGTGPSLAAHGIVGPLANPTLTLIRSSDGSVIATNDDWQAGPSATQLQAASLAPSNPLESAILVTLPPGAYTTILSGVGNGTGVGVIGVYRVN